MKAKRLFFIDALRAFAILMMLQGHFIDALLDPVYRDPNNSLFVLWSYFRGITAPTFFTISGLIFTYLLLRARDKNNDQLRIKKGLNRGLFLISIGYVLRIPIFDWLTLNFTNYVLVVDVLQVIGLSLIVLIVLYLICFRKCRLFGILCFLIGVFVFITEPIYRSANFDHLPLFISNYLTKHNGSVFTFLPWFGYMAFGAAFAVSFYKHLNKQYFKPSMILLLISLGILFTYYSGFFLNNVYLFTEVRLFKEAAYFNYLFTRLGNVLILFGLFYSFEHLLKHAILFKIGQKTLSIYIIHFIIIYGSFTGFGLSQILGKVLNPLQAILGVIIFLVCVCLLALYRVKTNAFIYSKYKYLLKKIKLN